MKKFFLKNQDLSKLLEKIKIRNQDKECELIGNLYMLDSMVDGVSVGLKEYEEGQALVSITLSMEIYLDRTIRGDSNHYQKLASSIVPKLKKVAKDFVFSVFEVHNNETIHKKDIRFSWKDYKSLVSKDMPLLVCVLEAITSGHLNLWVAHNYIEKTLSPLKPEKQLEVFTKLEKKGYIKLPLLKGKPKYWDRLSIKRKLEYYWLFVPKKPLSKIKKALDELFKKKVCLMCGEEYNYRQKNQRLDICNNDKCRTRFYRLKNLAKPIIRKHPDISLEEFSRELRKKKDEKNERLKQKGREAEIWEPKHWEGLTRLIYEELRK